MRSPVRLVWILAFASAFAAAPTASAEDAIDFEIRILEMEPKLADLLEERLAAGGEKAEAVHRNLPDLVRGGKIREADTVKIKARSGERGLEGAEFRSDAGISPKGGFRLEHDFVVTSDKTGVDAMLQFERAEKDRDGSMVARETVTVFPLDSGRAEVIDRFDRGGTAQLFLAKATVEGAKPAEGKSGGSRVRTRAEIFRMRDKKAAADAVAARGKAGLAKAQTDGVLIYAMGKAVRSGQKVMGREEVYLPRKRRDPRGVRFDATITVGRGKIGVSTQVDFDPWEKGETGGSAKAEGVVENRGAVLAQFDATPYVLAVHATAQGELIDEAPTGPLVARTAPAGKGADHLYVTTYPVPPTFLTLDGRRVSARELLEKKGVSFPKGASIFFNPSKSELVVRHNAEGHAAIVKVVNDLGP